MGAVIEKEEQRLAIFFSGQKNPLLGAPMMRSKRGPSADWLF
jgi:hypothetical protein